MGHRNLERSQKQIDTSNYRVRSNFTNAEKPSEKSEGKSDKAPSGLACITLLLILSGAMNIAYGALDILNAIPTSDSLLILVRVAMIALGLLMVVSGWGLGQWETWGLALAILSNFMLIGMVVLVYASNPIYAIASIGFSLGIVIYLLQPNIRNKYE